MHCVDVNEFQCAESLYRCFTYKPSLVIKLHAEFEKHERIIIAFLASEHAFANIKASTASLRGDVCGDTFAFMLR